MKAMAIFSAIVAGFVAAFFFAKGYVQSVYDRTGFNGFTPVHIVLSICTGLSALLAGAATGSPAIASACSALPLAALLILNFRSCKARFVPALTFMQVIYGVFAPLFIAIWLVNRYLLNVDIPSLSPKIDVRNTK